jgi:general secretion pathway protein C
MTPGLSMRNLQGMNAQAWLERATRTLPTAISVVAVVAIAWQLAQLTWLIWARFHPVSTSVPVIQTSAQPAARPAVNVQSIVDAHLFGVANAEVPEDNGANAPPTQMTLVLAATLAGPDPSNGFAIIGESAQSAKLYKTGAMVSGARLHAVYSDRAILDRSGKLEALVLPRQTPAGASFAAAPRPAANNNAFVNNLRHIAETNPSAFAEVVRPQPVFANGAQRGYRVYPGRNRQQFAKLGLQPGDLVLAVNGTPLDDPARGAEIFGTIGSADHVSLTIERNGQSQEITLNTAQINLPDVSSQRGFPPGGIPPGSNSPDTQ